MTINHRVRASLSTGQSKLALTNSIAIVASQLIALGCEVWMMRGGDSRYLVFAAIWGGFQVVRAGALHYLSANDGLLLGALIFIDKYTGPFGLFALDTAGVTMLQRHGRATRQAAGGKAAWSVPAALLVSLRQSSARYERPMWDYLLQHEDSWPVSLVTVVAFLASINFAFV
eukprot:793345-Prymnesium_polylepis.1